MANILAFAALVFFAQTQASSARFSSPSQAWTYAEKPMAEWNASLKAGRMPKPRIRPDREFYRRSDKLCPIFPVDSVSGEELYWLAKLCEHGGDFRKARSAAERYLAIAGGEHRSDAHMVLAVAQMRLTGNWEASWPTFSTVLQEDGITPEVETQIRGAVEDEADKNESTALQWSQERYERLMQRASHPRTGLPAINYSWVVMAGADLVHRYYLSGQAEEAAALLSDLNNIKTLHPGSLDEGWAWDSLNWSNMEMKSAPAIPVLKALGGNVGSDVVKKGRIEVVHFIFLRCPPCVNQLAGLNALEQRFRKEGLLVANVTTY